MPIIRPGSRRCHRQSRGAAPRLDQERRKSRASFKAVLNDVLRAGLDALHTRPRSRQPFRTREFDLGPSLVGSLDNIEEVLSRAEGEAHR